MKPLIATPCYGGMLCLNYVSSILRLRSAFWQLGIEHEFYMRSGESLITRARNDCVAYFMEHNYTHLFWIDADIGFDPISAIRLLNSGFDVVAGVYPRKSEKLSFPIDQTGIRRIDNGFAIVNEAPTGFMCISRNALNIMFESGIGRHEIFDTLIEDDEYLSEDYAFCRRWRRTGGVIHIDLTCHLSHQGTKLFVGNLGEHA